MGDILWINGKKYNSSNCDPNTRLSDFIRHNAKLRGTKVTCGEGGCGNCTVTVTRKCDVTGKVNTLTVNSCLCPIYTLGDAHVTTIEGLGNHQDGFHPLQKNIAAFNGSQCGYCTPGMVMSMYGLFCNNKTPTTAQIEGAFDGNLCRCTGYRPILDSAKDFIKDTGQQVLDIEDLCKYNCSNAETRQSLSEKVFNGKVWYTPDNLETLFTLLDKNKERNTRLVFGNTSTGIEKGLEFEVYINIRHVTELNVFKISETTIEVGANTTLQEMIELFTNPENDSLPSGFVYLRHALVPHLQKIGSHAIRNAGCCAGNLMLKHHNKMFPSDLFTPLEALQAKINIGHNGQVTSYAPVEFLSVDMRDKVIVSITLPAIDPHTDRFHTFKVMPRTANAYALVNASFYLKWDENKTNITSVRLAFGGISSSCHRAMKAETLLTNKSITSDSLKDVYQCLEEELCCEESPLLPSGRYRRNVARNLLHLFLQNARQQNATMEQFYESTSTEKPESTASYEFESKEEEFPYCQPMPKLDSCLQASGEAEYIGDKPLVDTVLHAACVLSEVARADIAHIDTSEAEHIPGVSAVITAKDMSVMKKKGPLGATLLAEDKVQYAGSPVAIVVADTPANAEMATKLVKVKYTNIQKPILDMKEAIELGSFHKDLPEGFSLETKMGDAENVYGNSKHQITGDVHLGTQYHFYMENHIAYCLPYDDMLELWASTQYPTLIQKVTAEMLGMPLASVNVKTLRLGGGFGGKSSNSVYPASIAATAAKIVKRPVRFAPSFSDCMKMFGKRFPVTAKYKIGVSADGSINSILMDYYHDAGYKLGQFTCWLCKRALTIMDNGYRIPNWKLSGHLVQTNKPPTTAMRAPDELPPAFIMEAIMNHVTFELDIHPSLLKEKHLLQTGDESLKGCKYLDVPLSEMWHDLKKSINSEEKERKIEAFNQTNRYRKRGFSMVPSKMFLTYNNIFAYNAYVTVYSADGTVAITHGAVEMGQGIHTKVIQVAAKSLGIDVNSIKVHTTATLTSADSVGTLGSLASECVCRSVLECCEELKKRMKPVKEENPSAPWKELVEKCYYAGIDMAVSYKFTTQENPHGPFAYCVFGVCAVEAEVDVLTGEYTINSLDAVFDIGESANPTIDIGQIEGALIMGMGYFCSEKEVYDTQTGDLLSDSTWEYKIPTATDIPRRMNVKLLKSKKNNLGVMPSKAIGEPPMLSSPAFPFAIKQAIASYRKEHGDSSYFSVEQPMSVDRVQELCNVKSEHLISDM